MKKPAVKVSIIVPVYNVAPYLVRCLDSLCAQTLADIEIICIDDKSTDNSLEILREYENTNPQIRVIAMKRNSGVAAARNAGINAANGEYVGFVDSDDYIDTDFYKKLYKLAMRTGADIARAGVQVHQLNGKTVTDACELRNIEKHGKWFFNWQWWCAIYRRKIIQDNKIAFPKDIICGEDTVFLANCINAANFVAFRRDTFYHYVRREGSLDEQIISAKKLYARISALNSIGEIYNRADMSECDYVSMYAWLMGGLHSHFYKNTLDKCRNEITQAVIELYQKCRAKSQIAHEVSQIFGTDGAACIQSLDAAGLRRILNQTQMHSQTRQETFFLFGAIPAWQTLKSRDWFIFRIAGIDIVRIKTDALDFRLWILYLPIIRKKRKFKR